MCDHLGFCDGMVYDMVMNVCDKAWMCVDVCIRRNDMMTATERNTLQFDAWKRRERERERERERGRGKGARHRVYFRLCLSSMSTTAADSSSDAYVLIKNAGMSSR